MGCLYDWINANAVLASATLLILAYVFIATEVVSKSVVALIGASLAILLGLVSQSKFLPSGAVKPNYFVHFIDFNVIFLLIAMMIIVSITTRSGIFTYIANAIMKSTKGRPTMILISLGMFTAVVSAFLDNVTTVILVMPITFAIAQKLDISSVPFLLVEIFASNIGGTATLIGDPPNIIIGSAAKFSFMDFVNELSGVVAVIFVVIVLFYAFVFRHFLKTTPERMAAISKMNNNFSKVVDRPLMIRSLVVLSLVIGGFVSHDYLKIETSVVALFGASILLLFEKPEEIFREVEWNTIFFFIGLFVIVGGLEASGGIKLMAREVLDITHGSQSATAFIILWASGVISGIIDNIPYTATMAPMIAEIQKSMGTEYAFPLWWCLSLGACLGGNMTIIGAAANVIVSENSAKHGEPISFMYFLKYGVTTVLISLSISSAYVWIRFL